MKALFPKFPLHAEVHVGHRAARVSGQFFKNWLVSAFHSPSTGILLPEHGYEHLADVFELAVLSLNHDYFHSRQKCSVEESSVSYLETDDAHEIREKSECYFGIGHKF